MKSAVCLFVKNEAQDILEWLFHYDSIGFDGLIIFDNMSTDGTSELITRFQSKLPIYHCLWEDTKPTVRNLTKQGSAYTACISDFKQEFDWIAFIDSDEFLIPPEGQTVRDLLDEFAYVSSFAINWKIFGSGGLHTTNGRLIMEAFDRRALLDFNPNRHVKMFVRPEEVRNVINPHFFETGQPCSDLNKNEISWAEPGIVKPNDIIASSWALHHYFTRSKEHWERRIARGQPSGAVREWGKFREYDKNDAVDTTAFFSAKRVWDRLTKEGVELTPVPSELDNPPSHVHPSHKRKPRQLEEQCSASIQLLLDVLSNGVCSGWAYDSNRRDIPLRLLAYIDDKQTAEFICDGLRLDVMRSDVGLSQVGFRFDIPDTFQDGEPHSFRVSTMDGDLVMLTINAQHVPITMFTLSFKIEITSSVDSLLEPLYDKPARVLHGAWTAWEGSGSTHPYPEKQQMSELLAASGRGDSVSDLRIPATFSYEIYTRYKDLAGLSEEDAKIHYLNNGMKEGRVCSEVNGRKAFQGIIPRTLSILEIGPFFSPAFSQKNYDVCFLDILSTEDLKRRAAEHGGSPENVPDIDYVWRDGSYAKLIDRKFDCVYSSHAIEHQPCLIGHLNEVSSVLHEGGRYFVIAPDKRFCFDRFFPESNIADVLDAYLVARSAPSPRAVMRGALLTTHNSASRHWANDQPGDPLKRPVTKEYGDKVKRAISQYKRDTYVDCHAWQFTPQSFSHLVELIHAAELTDMDVEAVYPTVKNTFEFYAILRKVGR